MTLFKVRENIKRFFDNADISRTVGKCENIQGGVLFTRPSKVLNW